MKQTIKYVRFEDTKVLIVPTAVGVALLEQRLGQKPTIDTIAGQEIAAFVVDLKSEIKHFRQETNKSRNTTTLYAYTVANTKFDLVVPAFVEEKKEEKK
jgi:hypothetical protein